MDISPRSSRLGQTGFPWVPGLPLPVAQLHFFSPTFCRFVFENPLGNKKVAKQYTASGLGCKKRNFSNFEDMSGVQVERRSKWQQATFLVRSRFDRLEGLPEVSATRDRSLKKAGSLPLPLLLSELQNSTSFPSKFHLEHRNSTKKTLCHFTFAKSAPGRSGNILVLKKAS